MMKEYNQIIKELREDKDMNQEELSQIFNISQQTLSQYETKRRALPIELLKEYAKFFEVSTDYILGLTNNKEPSYRIKKQVNTKVNIKTNKGNININ